MKLFDQKICHLTFTHTDCADVWKLYFPQMKKYFESGMEHYVAVDNIHDDLPKDLIPRLYNDKEMYPRRLFTILETLKDYDYVFFDHEDMFLYDSPDYNKLKEYYGLLSDGVLDHIRLIKGGDCNFTPINSCSDLYKFERKSKWIFSIQPSFWRRETLMSILKENMDVNIWELEVKSQEIVREIDLSAAFSHRSGLRRGIHHFDNNIYPYIATAIGKGKWNLGEYGKELEPLLYANGIDPTIRGWF